MRKKKAGGENTNRKTALIALSMSILIALLAIQTYSTGLGQSRSSNIGTTRTTTAGTTTTGTTGGITVQGTGKASVPPDRGIVTMAVVTQASTAGTAAQNNANTMSAVISALNSIGISNNDIQTVYYYIYPQSNYNTSPPTITGYQVTNEVQVTVVASGQTVEQLGTQIGHAIDTAASNGANQIYGVEFTASSSALQQVQQAALKAAAEDASQQAHTIALALGVTITGVVSVTTSPAYPQPVYLGISALSASATTPILPPQSLTATATVQATFSIS